MNRRDLVLDLLHNGSTSRYVPAAFFMHFDSAHHQGQAAIDRHLEFFRQTGMDFVKIQYEGGFPACPPIRRAEDWKHVPLVTEEFFEAPLGVVAGLVKAAKHEALVVMTLYSPFMWAAHIGKDADMAAHLQENPEAVKQGLEILTENVLRLARGCKRAGVDGFYASSQGGETFRFGATDLFRKYIKPTDLAVWDEIGSCPFNILHICDYEGGYADLSPFLDYPGQIVNSSLKLDDRSLTAKEVAHLFGRPFMGGLERKGVLATGDAQAVRQAAGAALAEAPERFILAADCTVPNETPWENLKTAIEVAHGL
ncbi:MAG: uroporphyrinogen decarboxylase family protein [Anaerolineales bacterium]